MTTLSVSLLCPSKAKVGGWDGVHWVAIQAGGIDFCVYVNTPEKAQAIADAINMEDKTDA